MFVYLLMQAFTFVYEFLNRIWRLRLFLYHLRKAKVTKHRRKSACHWMRSVLRPGFVGFCSRGGQQVARGREVCQVRHTILYCTWIQYDTHGWQPYRPISNPQTMAAHPEINCIAAYVCPIIHWGVEPPKSPLHTPLTETPNQVSWCCIAPTTITEGLYFGNSGMYTRPWFAFEVGLYAARCRCFAQL